MDFRDAWIYNPSRVELDFDVSGSKRKAYDKEKTDQYIKKLVDGWTELANMYRIKAVGRDRLLDELVRQGKIKQDEMQELKKRHVRQVAKEERFDLDSAQERFMK